MILNADGKQVEKRYTSDGTNVRTVYNADGDIVFEEINTAEGTLPQTFKSKGKPLVNYRIYGNAVQDGTPTPDNPVEVQGCGVETENGYKIDITSTNALENTSVTTPVYIGQSPLYKIGDYADYVDFKRGGVVRYVKELVLTEKESWSYQAQYARFYIGVSDIKAAGARLTTMRCTHYVCIDDGRSVGNVPYDAFYTTNNPIICFKSHISSIPDFKAFLAEQYSAGTPVKVYYVLATPEFEPIADLAKIPTFAPQTVIDADMTIKPSKIWYKYKP